MSDDTTPPVKKPAAKKKPAVEPASTQPTEVVEPVDPPAVEPPADSEPLVVVVDPPKQKRRRWPLVLIIVLVVLAILGTIAFFIGEAYAKDYARDYIKERIVAVLGIDDASGVTVDVGDGSVLLQAIAGRLNEVDVTADEVTFGTLSGAATVHAEGVPLAAEADTQKLDVTFAVPEEQVVSALGENLTGLPLESVALEEPAIVVTSTINLFFFQLPVGMGIVPSAEDGQIVFTPDSITLGDQAYTVEEVREQFGTLAEPLLAQKSVCVNESLPVALTIVDVDVVKKDLVLKINGDGVALGGTDLSTFGTCAG